MAGSEGRIQITNGGSGGRWEFQDIETLNLRPRVIHPPIL
jgi:hypothetical protein